MALQELFPEEGDAAGDPTLMLLSFEEFKTVMDEYDVIPIFVNPHKFAQHKQVSMAPVQEGKCIAAAAAVGWLTAGAGCCCQMSCAARQHVPACTRVSQAAMLL